MIFATLTIVGILIAMVLYICSLHAAVVADTDKHISLSPWHVICLAVALTTYAGVSAIAITLLAASPMVYLLFAAFGMASLFSFIAFAIVINNLRGRLKNEQMVR